MTKNSYKLNERTKLSEARRGRAVQIIGLPILIYNGRYFPTLYPFIIKLDRNVAVVSCIQINISVVYADVEMRLTFLTRGRFG